MTKVKGALAAALAAEATKRPTFMVIVERLEAMQPTAPAIAELQFSATQILLTFAEATTLEIKLVDALLD